MSTRENIIKKSLHEIATILTGVFAKPSREGEIVYLQTKHFNERGQLNSSLHRDLKFDNQLTKHLLRDGDVVFAAKGSKNFAAYYESENPPAVASTSFFVIKLGDNFRKKILPAYLVWFINHPNSQQFLKRRAIGTSMVSISKTVLEELEISIPAMETQETILKIAQLRNAEKKLKKQLEILRENKIQQQITNALK